MKKDIKGEKKVSPKLTKEDLLLRQYENVFRFSSDFHFIELKIKRMRASVVRNQVVRAYEIIENIRFDYLGDTMFRDYFTRVKKNLEGALGDFLLNDTYWGERIAEHRKTISAEHDKKMNTLTQEEVIS